MAKVGYPFRRLRNFTAKIISAPSVARSTRRGNQAVRGIKAIKFLRETKGAGNDPKTSIGRKRLSAMFIKSREAKRLKK